MDHDSPFKDQAGVSVSKRNFKKAVDRNRIKRLMRESIRKNKYLIYDSEDTKKHIFMFIYQGKSEVSYQEIEERMIELIESFLPRQKSSEHEENEKRNSNREFGYCEHIFVCF